MFIKSFLFSCFALLVFIPQESISQMQMSMHHPGSITKTTTAEQSPHSSSSPCKHATTLTSSINSSSKVTTTASSVTSTVSHNSSTTNEVHQTLIIDTIFPYKNSKKPIVSANYSFPGPVIEAYEGDTLVIRVINRLTVPSTIHCHGMYQRKTPDMDGGVGASQCAIPPQNEMIYKFKAEPAGTFWYHGHLLSQYTDGLIGPLIIRQRNQPNTYKFDSEHILMVSDWYNNQAETQLVPWYLNVNNPEGFEPSPDAIVVNGKFTQSLFIPTNGSKRICFRIINAAAFSMYTVSIDGLPLHIIELDQSQTLPYSVQSFSINVAQRVSFYIDLNELHPAYTGMGTSATKSLYIRFQAMVPMYPVDILNYIPPYEEQRYPYPVFFHPLYLAILSLDSKNSTPRYQASDDVPMLPNVMVPKDSNILAARPINNKVGNIPEATHYLHLVVNFHKNENGINLAYLNNVTYSSPANYMDMVAPPTEGITSDKFDPILHQMVRKPNDLRIPQPRIENGSKLPVLQSDGYGHYLVPYNAVVDVFLENMDEGEHPFHLHSFDFWIIATSNDPKAEELYKGNYLRRDIVSVPPNGWVKIRFVANNPGAWFFHCHIEWHMTAGLSLVFVVSPEELIREGFTVTKTQSDLCEALRHFDANSSSQHKHDATSAATGMKARCDMNNGGCGHNATCSQATLMDQVVCTCKPGYTNIGKNGKVECKDSCEVNNGECGLYTICSHHINTNRVLCSCKPGYVQTGLSGMLLCKDSCAVKNGGCGDGAKCSHDPNTHAVICTCKPGYTNVGSGNNVLCKVSK